MATLNGLSISLTDGYLKLPSGSTDQRPLSPLAGQVRINNDGFEEVYTPSGWRKEERLITNGLQCYLDAGISASYESNRNSPVTANTWYDISGNNRNFTWVSAPTFRRYGSTAYFLTSGNRATGPASNSFGINNSSGYTIFWVSRNLSYSANSAFKFYTTLGKNSSSTSRAIFTHPGWSNQQIYFDQGGCCSADQRTELNYGEVMSTWNVWTVRSTVATRSIFRNGIVGVTNSTAAADINLGSATVDLASSDEYGGDSSGWNAYLSAFLVYNRGLTDAEIKQVNNYLQRRMGA